MKISDAFGAGALPVSDWKLRLRAGDVGLPLAVRHDQGRHAVTLSRNGVTELHWWRPNDDELSPATGRPGGTSVGVLDPTGAELWWFDDTGGDERGTWQRQSWGTPPGAHVSATALPPAHSMGLALGAAIAVTASMDSEYGVRVHRLDRSARLPPVLLYQHREAAVVGELSSDDLLVVIAHSERGDANHMALRVVSTATGDPVGELDDGPGRDLRAGAFSPVPGDQRLLVLHERHTRTEVLVWDPTTGRQTSVPTSMPGEVKDAWWIGDSSILLAVDHEAQVRLARVRLADGAVTWSSPAEGTVSGAAVRSDGVVDARWSSAAHPWCIRRWQTQQPEAPTGASEIGGQIVLGPPNTAVPSVPVRDVWVEGSGGMIHALLRLPSPSATRDLPLVMLLHGGPAQHDSDAFHPQAAAWVDQGYAVAQVNYRGSTGYGTGWRQAHLTRLGHVELEDVVAVRNHLVVEGVADPARVVLAGTSWGGFLTLLGLGTVPDAWAAGIAQLPVADYLAAYEDESEALKAFDRALFGGSPSEVLAKYLDASPMTYVDQVRAPLLIVAAERDSRCPLRQVHNYENRLAELAVPHEVVVLPGGHRNMDAESKIAVLERAFAFLDVHVHSLVPLLDRANRVISTQEIP